MITLSWNCRGLARAMAKRTLWVIDPNVIFLFEAKIPIRKCSRFLMSLGFYNLDSVDSRGKKGGLVVGWKNGFDIEINYKCSNVFNGLIFLDPLNEPWLITFVYGPPNHNNRGSFWEVEKVGEVFGGGWLCIGDFNHVFSQADKKGGKPVASSSSGGLNDVIDKNGLIDIKFSGNPYTWSNGREGLANIKERLDRAFANERWRLIFPRVVVLNLPSSNSDHSPIVLFTEGEQQSVKRPFKFEEVWTRYETSWFVVEKAWKAIIQGSSLFKVCQKLK